MHVAITGVSSGIGLEQARVFLENGHVVFGLDLRESMEIKELMNEFSKSFTFICGDVTKRKTLHEHLVPVIEKRLDVLCNTAGQLDGYQSLEETTGESWDHILAVNLTGTFNVTSVCLKYLLQNKASRIINITSIAGLTSGGGGIAYTSAKHGLVGFTKQLAHDYSTKGLRVNGIAPGAIATPMNQKDFQEERPLAKWVQEQVPTKRWAIAKEVAQLTYYLASNSADYIQGAIIPIDGGWLIK